MPDSELTELYLAEVASRGMGPRELVDAASREVDLAATTYFGRCLTRPVFLNQADHTQLAADLENLYRALTALPARLFGGKGAHHRRAQSGISAGDQYPLAGEFQIHVGLRAGQHSYL